MLVITAAVLGGIVYWKAQQGQMMAEMQSQPQPPAPVAATEVKQVSWQPSLKSTGSLVAINDVFITNEFAGLVDSIEFESGDVVEKGQLLVRLNDDVDRAQLAGLQSELRLAEVQFKRAEGLLSQRSVSQSDYDEAKARVDNARANLEAAQVTMDKKRIRAPFSGQLGIRQIDLGQYLAAGAQIVSLQSLDPIYVDYAVPERFLNDLQVGQAISISIQAYPEEQFSGTIQAIDPGIDVGTRSVVLRALLENNDQRLRPGMFAEVRTLLPIRDDILTLPRQAISYAPYGDSVFAILEKDGKQIVQRKQVTTGEVRDGYVEIVDGLNAGDMVVTSGQTKLRNDREITIDNSIELDYSVDQP
ncbi:MAG: efflux RND transporter periplasmic adaptor subunit [Gammaproteobacteria bacterium]